MYGNCECMCYNCCLEYIPADYKEYLRVYFGRVLNIGHNEIMIGWAVNDKGLWKIFSKLCQKSPVKCIMVFTYAGLVLYSWPKQ